MNRVPLRDRCRGRWHGILVALGIDHRYLSGKNGPCPLCPGGRDRWRFLDTDGAGTWICTHCGSGDGFELVMRLSSLPFKDAAQRIEAVLGDVVSPSPRRDRSERQIRAGLNSIWSKATPLRHSDAVDRWLRSRDIILHSFPSCLRMARRLPYYSSASRSYHPAMLALVRGADGRPATIHRTYLTEAGNKAAVESPRKLFSPMPKGAAVRLGAPGATLGIAEGIETALAAQILFSVPTWAAICANGLANFEPPQNVKRLLIFADNDDNQVGQQAALRLASRLSGDLKVETIIPPDIGQDWNDVLSRSGH